MRCFVLGWYLISEASENFHLLASTLQLKGTHKHRDPASVPIGMYIIAFGVWLIVDRYEFNIWKTLFVLDELDQVKD